MPRSFAVAVVLAGALTLAACGSSSDDSTASIPGSAAPTTAAVSTTDPAAAVPSASAPAKANAKGSGTFNGVTVANPTDLKSQPHGTSTSTTVPAKLEYKDLVVGTGAAANPASTVNVQYEGFLYTNGTAFDSSWANNGGQPISFPLTGVVPGFTQGIGGTTGVPPMKVGGRRIMILPPALGYPDGNASIPPNTPIVFIVDLVALS